jgi:GTP-binding protein
MQKEMRNLMFVREDIRNIAIIAHVDHGKTTLVDQMLRQGGVFRENQQVQDRVMDSNDLERERGITILSKNTAIRYKGLKINIIDTPGHADFGGEVERVLKMVNGVLLLVDAFEGPMPQTKFVLKKALELKHPVIVVINKIDRPEARPSEVIDEVLDLFIELEAAEEQLDCPFVFASAREGTASLDINEKGMNILPLFDVIQQYIPAPSGDLEGPLQILVSTIDYNDYVGRIAIGKVDRGRILNGQDALLCNVNGGQRKVKITNLYQFEGLKRTPVEAAQLGDIVAVSGVEGINIGETICEISHPEPLPFVNISQPTISMTFSVNTSPFAGQDGRYVTSRNLRENTKAEVRYVDWDGPYSIPADTNIVVNATSVGLYPDVNDIPNINLDSITPDMFVQDVIPNPTETALIKEMRLRGIPCATGAGMLINQAALNIEMWTGLKPDKDVMYKALEEALT